jgi:predicted DNA-binding transcriptional regulator YafY
MREFLSVRFDPHKTYRTHREIVDRVSRATAERRTVQIRYFSASSGKTGRREVDLYHIWYAAGGLYLIGYCHSRRDVRMFAVERIRSLTITDHAYQLPLDFDVEAYVQDALVVMRGRQIHVELRFDRATAARARDRIWRPRQQLTPLRDGRLRMTLRVADTEQLEVDLEFLRGVRVMKSSALCEEVQQEAPAVARQ